MTKKKDSYFQIKNITVADSGVHFVNGTKMAGVGWSQASALLFGNEGVPLGCCSVMEASGEREQLEVSAFEARQKVPLKVHMPTTPLSLAPSLSLSHR